MSPFSIRFLILPMVALAVIMVLSQTQAGTRGDTTPSLHRATTCAAPAQGADASCVLATIVPPTVVR